MQVQLTVIRRFDPVARPREVGCAEMRVFRVEVDQSFDWIKQHADAIATQATHGAPYHALMVQPLESSTKQ